VTLAEITDQRLGFVPAGGLDENGEVIVRLMLPGTQFPP
jgi:hypothetical protein